MVYLLTILGQRKIIYRIVLLLLSQEDILYLQELLRPEEMCKGTSIAPIIRRRCQVLLCPRRARLAIGLVASLIQSQVTSHYQ